MNGSMKKNMKIWWMKKEDVKQFLSEEKKKNTMMMMMMMMLVDGNVEERFEEMCIDFESEDGFVFFDWKKFGEEEEVEVGREEFEEDGRGGGVCGGEGADVNSASVDDENEDGRESGCV